MKRWKWILLATVLVGTVLLGVVALRGKGVGDIPAGTGYAALDLCTRTMRSGEPRERVRARYVEPKVRPLPTFWRIEHVAGSHVTVRTWLPMLDHPRTAVYREGLGCTVVPPGWSEERVRAQPFRAAPPPPADERPWPFGEGAAETGRLGPSHREVLERHTERLFRETTDDPARRRNTTALLVARDGHLVFERYAHGHGRDDPQIGWSMTKTLTAVIAGTFARDGAIGLDDEVGLSRWSGTPKQAISWRALLNMAPGLAWFEGYGGASDATEMLFSRGDQGAWAADRPLTSEPGTVFTYSTGFTNIAMLRMRELLGGTHQAIYDHYQRELFAPLGIRDGVIEPDASGTPVGGARGVLRPVDWLRLGQLLANGGAWDGARILPRAWVAFMVAPSPADPQYGGSIWRRASPHIDPALRARLPRDLVYFAGHLGQFTVVVPSRDLVVLRMGVDLGGRVTRDGTLHAVLHLVADLLDV
ncbi:MAG: serine hydrolase domain-containing protein [Myxococcota bacterium]